MADLENELKDLREKNVELVKKMQFWMMTAAERENEKINLMKELNELRLNLATYRNKTSSQDQSLQSALQSASEKALAHLVRASSEIARTMELTKTFMVERQEAEAVSPRWSTIGGTPNEKRDKVHRVPPLMVGGQSIQPVVALSRAVLNTSIPRSTANSPTQRNVTQRAFPMHMLQDVYIPLMRIDADPLANTMDVEESQEGDDSTEQIAEDEDSQRISEEEEFDESSRRLDDVAEDVEPSEASTSPRAENPLEGPSWLLDSVSPQTNRTPGVLEQTDKHTPGILEPDSTTEPPDHTHPDTEQPITDNRLFRKNKRTSVSPTFSPTVRRRKRTSSPHRAALSPHRAAPSPHRAAMSPHRAAPSPHRVAPAPQQSSGLVHSPIKRNSPSGRVLKVVVAKMRLDSSGRGVARGGGADTSGRGVVRGAGADSSGRGAARDGGADSSGRGVARAGGADSLGRGLARDGGADSLGRGVARAEGADSTPPTKRRPFLLDAPSPNGATMPGLIVSDRDEPIENASHAGGEPCNSRDTWSRDTWSTARERSTSADRSSNSDTDRQTDGRTRRARRAVTYKEIPLNSYKPRRGIANRACTRSNSKK